MVFRFIIDKSHLRILNSFLIMSKYLRMSILWVRWEICIGIAFQRIDVVVLDVPV